MPPRFVLEELGQCFCPSYSWFVVCPIIVLVSLVFMLFNLHIKRECLRYCKLSEVGQHNKFLTRLLVAHLPLSLSNM